MYERLLALLVLSTALISSRAASDPVILAVFDLHRSVNQNGDCFDPDVKAIEMVMAMQWMAERNSSNPVAKLVVLNTCGSSARAVQLLGPHVYRDNCTDPQNTAGIISYTSPEVSDVIRDLLRHSGLLHIALQDTATTKKRPVTEPPNYLQLMLPSGRLIQNVVELLKQLNWMYVSTQALQRPRSQAEESLFRDAATIAGICLGTTNAAASMGHVIFASGVDDNLLRSSISSSLDASSKVVIVASDAQTIAKINNMNVLWTGLVLAEEHPPNNDLVVAAVDGTLFGSWLTMTAEYYRSSLGCDLNAPTSQMQCTPEKVRDYFALRSQSRDISASMSAFSAMDRSIRKAIAAGCTQFRIDKCSSILPPENPSLSGSFYFTSIKERIFLDQPFSVSVYYIKPLSATVQIGTLYDANFSPNQSQWDEASDVFSPLVCNRTCSDWNSCNTKAHDTTLSMRQEGDVLISGMFSIRTTSPLGASCSSWSWEGLQAAEAFMYAIRTIKLRHPGKLSLPGIGGVLTDTCDNKGKSVCETNVLGVCGEITATVKPGSTAIAATDVIGIGKPAVLVSELGVNTLDHLEPKRYSLALSKVLKTLRWTYVVVVHSSDTPSNEFINRWRDSLHKQGICIAMEIPVSSENVTKVVPDIPADSGTFLLLTDSYMTDAFLETVIENPERYNIDNMVFFPWNKNSIEKLSNKKAALGSILVEMKPDDISDFDFLKFLTPENSQSNPWLKDFHQWRYGCYAPGGVVDYADVCWRKHTSTSLSVSPFVGKVSKTVDSVVFALDAIYKELCPLQTGLCEEFNTETINEKLGAALRALTVEQNGVIGFSSAGEMELPLEVFNYQKDGDTVLKRLVGNFNASESLVLNKNDVRSYTSDGQVYISNSECTRWCPSCYKCSSSRQQSRDNVYTAGELVVSGLFPIHTSGEVFECGSRTISNFTEVLVEAFLYAVKTAQSRYPTLLPNVTLGSLVVDTCSDASQSLMSVLQFENCDATFDQKGEAWPVSPKIVQGYVVYDQYSVVQPVTSAIGQLKKLVFSPISSGEKSVRDLNTALDTSKAIMQSVVDVLLHLNWTYISVVATEGDDHMLTSFSEMTLAKNICIVNIFNITTRDQDTIDIALDHLRESDVQVGVMLAGKMDTLQLFVTQEYRRLSQSWIIAQMSDTWSDSDVETIPPGNILLSRKHFVNTGFKSYFEEIVAGDSNRTVQTINPWLTPFRTERCSGVTATNTCPAKLANTDTWKKASDIIKAVDIILHAWDIVYNDECADKEGLCVEFAASTNEDVVKALSGVSFVSSGEIVRFTQVSGVQGTYVIRNRHPDGVTQEVGEWNSGELSLDIGSLKGYNKYSQVLRSFPVSRCIQNCKCLNGVVSPDGNKTHSELQFWDTSSQFSGEIWAVVVITVGGTGIFLTLLVTLYVLCKVCAGALMKRYIALGLTMLLAITLLYLSVLPFIFTPSHVVCGMRFFAPGFAYAFSFGIILVKLMSLREYKLIGLGGEVSNLNQFLTVLFISGVQIAIGVQWWILNGTLLVEIQEDGVTQYACNFVRKDFAIYLVYVMFLIVLCTIYAILMRKDTKNMGESRLLLACSIICIMVWIAWIVVMMVQPRWWVEPTICVGIIVCATLKLLVTFIPKVLKIAQLKYDVTVKSRPENGYKLDNDFFFERPYSLPGTLRSSGSEKNISTFPRSIATFDSSLSY